ncbi:glycosyl hydrolase family 95 catalytic domain-containing protein [Oleiagrimonas soli]|uniref:Trehalose/maltose hydrolase-like predicted phosphorylase n=1 Tax=Oleiagrimonas soli TaxID=1543381 RepID=A0A841KIJ3_9GAMM|nr:glycosyl hydrolase family 65 protein [Oleiagrimonas soli]MBB6185443.1 trehalose/maltose hydrolase-like predicted phosphorylase [Oleiagrimonas soli]
MRPRFTARLLSSLLALTCACASASAATPDSFLLTATSHDFGHYFPTYLANGYFSTMSTPRGTGPARAYMAAFMDYTRDDISRPAAIPGWSEVDYNPGGGWLNAVRLDATHFADYAQTLNMRDGTLRTRYRFDYAHRATDVRVTTFVSQADKHLAATRFTITPQFNGTVQLRFPLRLWSQHAPRFAIGKLDYQQLTDAVIASGQNLGNKPVPTADRAPIWYPGYTRMLDARGDTKARTLRVDGRAVQGLRMAMAAALDLPDGLALRSLKLHQGPHRLSLDLTAEVEAGHTYTFVKYVAASRQDWGGDAQADRALAQAARARGLDALLAEHRAAWHRLWQSDIVIDGDPRAQKAVHSDLYYLLSNTTTDTAWPMGACALTPNYAGHAFWDSDSWVFPALLLLHPERAKPIVMFRHRTLPQALDRARQFGVKGAMYPWEADPQTGIDNTPHFAHEAWREIHVNADVAIAQWQYYLATGDRAWLKHTGWPVIRDVARFWASRVTWNKAAKRFEILHVTSPDEAYDDVPNDSFTNAAARKALRIAVRAAKLVGAKPDPRWTTIADAMYVPFDARAQRHYDFDPSAPHDKITWMGSSLAWLMYPNLDLPMTPAVRRNDLTWQLEQLKTHGDDPNEMMMVMLAVAEAELGDAPRTGYWIDHNLHGFLKPPFNVRTETRANNAGYILATSAGFVQSLVYGLSGLRLEHGGLRAAYPPVLPPSWTSMTLRNVDYRGQRYDIVVDRDASGHVRLRGLPPSVVHAATGAQP